VLCVFDQQYIIFKGFYLYLFSLIFSSPGCFMNDIKYILSFNSISLYFIIYVVVIIILQSIIIIITDCCGIGRGNDVPYVIYAPT